MATRTHMCGSLNPAQGGIPEFYARVEHYWTDGEGAYSLPEARERMGVDYYPGIYDSVIWEGAGSGYPLESERNGLAAHDGGEGLWNY